MAIHAIWGDVKYITPSNLTIKPPNADVSNWLYKDPALKSISYVKFVLLKIVLIVSEYANVLDTTSSLKSFVLAVA